jgi:hypothetical protein
MGESIILRLMPRAKDCSSARSANHRLFVGCRLPSKLVVLNTESGDVVAKIDISGDPDDVFYDSKRHRIYAICGAGKIDIVDQTDPNTYTPSTKVDTADGAPDSSFRNATPCS